MSRIERGRMTAGDGESFVVFIIGMRINRLWAIRKWLPTVTAMRPMLQTLFRHPEKGFLGGQVIFYPRGVGLIQYWRSFADLERFAHDPAEPHLGPWRRFNRVIGGDGSVGIWHETYEISPGCHESIYVNMPVWGLAKATRHVPAVGRSDSARGRLGRRSHT